MRISEKHKKVLNLTGAEKPRIKDQLCQKLVTGNIQSW